MPDSGLGFQVKVSKNLKRVPSSLDTGTASCAKPSKRKPCRALNPGFQGCPASLGSLRCCVAALPCPSLRILTTSLCLACVQQVKMFPGIFEAPCRGLHSMEGGRASWAVKSFDVVFPECAELCVGLDDRAQTCDSDWDAASLRRVLSIPVYQDTSPAGESRAREHFTDSRRQIQFIQQDFLRQFDPTFWAAGLHKTMRFRTLDEVGFLATSWHFLLLLVPSCSFFLITLHTGPKTPLSLVLGDTQLYYLLL